MPTFNQPKTLADLLIVEVAQGWTKQRLAYAAGAAHVMGTVLAKVSGKLQALDPAGAGAAKVAYAVAAEKVDASASDTSGLTIARGATLDIDELVWPEGITDVQKAAALAELDARGITTAKRI